ncbi:tape measure protein [Klebsiella aerogenes]|uniref:tape measure protein n=1 Tax=Klebsiella aerogenes TaxID=548 RepID=UPI003979853A
MSQGEKVGGLYIEIEADTAKLLAGERQANKSLNAIGNSADNASKKFEQLQTSLNKVAGAVAASIVVDWGRAFLVAADNMSQLNARVERLTGSASSASQTMQSLMRVSSSTGGSIQDTTKLWESLSTALRDTGASNGQIIQLTETLQKIGRIGSTSSEEMANALRQFGQSISSGTVRAEEFNSILEQMPELARQIAAGMGIGVGELRQLMLEGKLSAQDALNAIQKQTVLVNTEFEKLPRTLSQANTSLTNSFLTMVDNLNKATGASNGMVLVIDSLAVAIGRLTGQAATASQQIADLRSEAEMYARRARTWGWLGFGDWQKENEQKSAKLTADAWEKASRAGWDAAQKVAKNTKPIEIKAVSTTSQSKAKGGKSAAQKEAEQYARAQELITERLSDLKSKAELSASSITELSRAQAILNAQQSLGKAASQEQIALAGGYAAKAWDNAKALREQAKAEKERADAASKFSSIQYKSSRVIGLDTQYQQDIADIKMYAQMYPQKIAEAEAARSSIEKQYRDQRIAAMWQEWAQQTTATQAAAAAFDGFANSASNALTGIVTGSMAASDALRSIGNTILNEVINTFVQMGVQWAKSAILGATTQQAAIAATTATQVSSLATTTAASTSSAAATTAAWTPAALVASIGSFGGAVAIGLGALVAALAVGSSLAGKRKNGGPVSAGSMYQVGEGGMPEIYRASNGSQYMIPGDNGSVISNKDLQGSGGGALQVVNNVYNYANGVNVDTRSSQNGGQLVIDTFITDMQNGGPMSSQMQDTFGLRRQANGDY